MNELRFALLPLTLVAALIVGQPTPPTSNPKASIWTLPAPTEETRPASGIDWSAVEPSFPDFTGVYPIPVDSADPWLEPERFTDCTKVACIALTFDDGPLPGPTDAALKVLEEMAVPATFFVVGQFVKKYPEVLLETIAQGHEVAAHSYAHSRLTELSSESLTRDFDKTNSILLEVTGQTPSYYRPPYGMHNQRVRDAAGMPTIMWSIDPQDWRKANSASQIVRYVLSRAHPGAIVLFHETLAKTTLALPEIIAGLREQGYELVTLKEILGSPLNPEAVYRSGLTPPETAAISD